MGLFNKNLLDQLRRRKKRWQARNSGHDQEKPFGKKKNISTSSGIEIDPLYVPSDVGELDYSRDLGFPGDPPFTRGAYPSMYRGRTWTRRQIAGFGTAKSTNERFRFLLAHGQTGLSTDFDHPTLTGYDSDHELAEAEVGRLGVAVDTIKDVDELFSKIPIDKVGISMTINHPAIVLLAMFLGVAETRGVSWSSLRGTVQNDSLKEFYGQKTFALPPGPSLKLTTDIIQFCTEHVPNWYTVSISGYHTREAGASAVQELAFTLAQGMAYAEAAIERGLHIDKFAPRFSYFFGCHNEIFEEIGKFRAARRMWARIVKERYSAKKPESMRMRFHTQTLGSTLVRAEPRTNISRGTLQALAAVLGGTQSLHVSGYDEAYDIPSEDAMKISLLTQLVIANETGVGDTIDPLGGSFFVESLTNTLEEKAWSYINLIEKMGDGSMTRGMLRAIETGYIEKEIADSAFEYQQALDRKDKVVVGLNEYQPENEQPIEVFEHNIAEEDHQISRLREIRSSRNNFEVEKALDDLKRAVEAGENLLPQILNSAKLCATEGEMMGVLQNIFGEYTDAGVF